MPWRKPSSGYEIIIDLADHETKGFQEQVARYAVSSQEAWDYVMKIEEVPELWDLADKARSAGYPMDTDGSLVQVAGAFARTRRRLKETAKRTTDGVIHPEETAPPAP